MQRPEVADQCRYHDNDMFAILLGCRNVVKPCGRETNPSRSGSHTTTHQVDYTRPSPLGSAHACRASSSRHRRVLRAPAPSEYHTHFRADGWRSYAGYPELWISAIMPRPYLCRAEGYGAARNLFFSTICAVN